MKVGVSPLTQTFRQEADMLPGPDAFLNFALEEVTHILLNAGGESVGRGESGVRGVQWV